MGFVAFTGLDTLHDSGLSEKLIGMGCFYLFKTKWITSVLASIRMDVVNR